MKINPIAIQNYQTPTTRRETPAGVKPEAQEQSVPTQASVKIDPQQQAERSRLAIQPQQAAQADNLSPDELRAVELLFNRFQDTSRFGAGYGSNAAEESDEPGVGNLLDLKA
jgi:hypothetical protein